MITLLLNHLWQSSLCVGAAGLIALTLQQNSAHIRFWLWFAASLKFLLPFAALTALGAVALTPMVAPVAVPSVALVEPLAKPFSAPRMIRFTTSLTAAPAHPAKLAQRALPAQASMPVAPAVRAHAALPAADVAHVSLAHVSLETLLLALWFAGFLMLTTRWLMRGWRVRALLRQAVDLRIDCPVAVKVSASRQVPGLVGILHPVILLPQGIQQQLSPAELRAILAHELCHWRRHDNFLAVFHMVVQALFWFFPLVWWLGARLNAERECACDESVLANGNDPQMYAEGILKVCRAYLQSPLACVAGVSGSILKKRIEAIMENRLILQLNAARKFALSALAAAAFALPLALGLTAAPVARTEAKAAPLPMPADTQRRSEPAPAPEASTAALSSSKAAGIPLGGQAALYKKEAANVVADATLPPPVALPIPPQETPVPDAMAPASVTMASNDPPPAQPPSNNASAPTCALPKLADTAELKPVAGSDLMTVPVEINGKLKQFLLDIGTNPTEVSQATVAELGLPESTKMASTLQIGGNGSTSNMGLQQGLQLQVPVYDVKGNQAAFAQRNRVRIGAFTIGGATARNMQFMVANDGEIAKSAPYDGLLTNEILKQYDVEVNFAAKQINFLTPASCTDPSQVAFWSHFEVAAIPVTMADGKIQVPVTIEGHPLLATIDTSSERSIMRRDVAELTLGYKGGTPAMMPSGDLKDGMGQPVYAHTFSQIAFAGGVTAVNVPALIQTNSMSRDTDQEPVLGSRAPVNARLPDFIIGMDVLRHLHLYFVLGQGKLYVTAAQ